MSRTLPNDLEQLTHDCPACHGTGLWAPLDVHGKPTGAAPEECQSCWGAGTRDGYLNHWATLDLRRRERIVDGYSAPDFKD